MTTMAPIATSGMRKGRRVHFQLSLASVRSTLRTGIGKAYVRRHPVAIGGR